MTDWVTATGVLLSGAIIGFMFLYVATRSAAAAPTAGRSLEVRDLEAKRDALIAQLRELDDTGGTAEERAKLEREAADVLRRLDGLMPAGAGEGAGTLARPKAASKSSALKGFLWGAASAAAIAGLVLFVMNSAKTRTAGDSPTGAPMAAAPRPAQGGAPDAEVQRLEAAVKAAPDDVALRNDLTKAYLDHDNMIAAFQQAQMVLEKSPDDARALTYQGIVRIAMGEAEQASKQLERATRSDPSLLDGWVALAWSYMQTGREDDAGKAIASAKQQHPEQAARLDMVYGKMREQVHQPAAGSAPAPASGAQAAAPAVAGGAGAPVRVTITLAPGATMPASKTLFLFARANGQTAGPPAAAKRLTVDSFPFTAELSDADSMMGQPLPASMTIQARVDADGDPTTKGLGDLAARQDGVARGDAVSLVLH
jgi:tetratricopeptide (TPR) repeat protein